MFWFWHMVSKHLYAQILFFVVFFGCDILFRNRMFGFNEWKDRTADEMVRAFKVGLYAGVVLIIIGTIVWHLIYGCWQ